MKVSAILSNNQCFAAKPSVQYDNTKCSKPHINPVSVTGWTAVGGIGAAMVSGIMHYPKLHKLSAAIGLVAIAAHVAIVTTNHKKHHNVQKEFKA